MEYLFVEMKPFTDAVIRHGLEDDVRRLEDHLRRNPTAGTLDPGACGLRKIRMGDEARGRGKRSGARVHYLYIPHRQTIYFFSVYLKSEQKTLTPEQKKMLCAVIRGLNAR